MISEFFLNGCILITFLSIIHILFKDRKIETGKRRVLILEILSGIVAGILGIILILNAVHVNEDTLIDFRHIPILLTAMYGGYVSIAITTVEIAIFRILYHEGLFFINYNVFDTPAAGAFLVVVIGIGFAFICNYKFKNYKKFILCMFYLIPMFSLFLYFIIGAKKIYFYTITLYAIANVSISFIVLIYAKILIESVTFNKKLKDNSIRDFLTGALNVRGFKERFESISRIAVVGNVKISLLLIDIDFFKRVNDTYGHLSGDLALKALVKLVNDEIDDLGIVSRNGGEEFSVLLSDCNANLAVEIAERIRRKVELYKIKIHEDLYINVTVSIGVATYKDTTKDIKNLFGDSDKALYEAKGTGRNRVILYRNS